MVHCEEIKWAKDLSLKYAIQNQFGNSYIIFSFQLMPFVHFICILAPRVQIVQYPLEKEECTQVGWIIDNI